MNNNEYDAIVVGSGPGGATVARELTKRGQRVLIVERGGIAPIKDGMMSTLSVLDAVRLGGELMMGRALTTGGTSSIYLGATVRPPLEAFQSLGIDLTAALEEAEKELPLATLPDTLLRPQSLKLRDSAVALGYKSFTSRMLVDQTKCNGTYSHTAKWTARAYVDEALQNGATIVNRARVMRVLTDGDRATGVEYEVPKSRKKSETHRAYAPKVVVAAGGAATPVILQRTGISKVADHGFYCHPGFMLFGTISGLEARDGFGGSWGIALDGGIRVGDANFNRTLHRLIMLGQHQWIRAFTHSRGIGMGVMVKDGFGGELKADGTYSKELSKEDSDKLAQGEDAARRIIEHAGGKNIVKSSMSAAHIGGAIRIKEHVDEKLETEVRNLYVCDGSVLPETVNTPALSLICLGKYLANQIAPAA